MVETDDPALIAKDVGAVRRVRSTSASTPVLEIADSTVIQMQAVEFLGACQLTPGFLRSSVTGTDSGAANDESGRPASVVAPSSACQTNAAR